MFSCKFFEGNILKKLVESIKDVVNNVNIDVSDEGLSFQAMDLSHVALVTLSLKADGFQEYKSHKNQSLGVKLQNLHKVLKCANSSDVITLECEDEPQELNLKFESPDQSKVSKFTLSLMLQEEEQLQIPNTVYSSKVELPSSEFSRIVRELSQLSDSVKIETNKKAITFSVVGDVSSGEMEIKENNIDKEGERISVEVDEPVTMSFSLTFLNSFCKASSLSDSVKLFMSEGTPLVIEYKIGELGELKFYLAPKLSDNQFQFFIFIFQFMKTKFFFILFTSLFTTYFISIKNFQFIEHDIIQLEVPFLLAKAIIEEPQLLQKWFYFENLWNFEDFIRIQNNTYIGIKVYQKYSQQLQIQIDSKQNKNVFTHIIKILDYPNTQIEVNLEKKSNTQQIMKVQLIIDSKDRIFNSMILIQKIIGRKNIIKEITKKLKNQLEKEIQRQNKLREEWDSKSQLNQI